MKNNNIPRIMIAGTSSNCGKTTVTVALLQALVNRKLKVSSFKCGPDYIDPMFHGEIIGAKSSNLDSFFCDENSIKYLLAKNSNDSEIAVIEGVMGFYDGAGLNTTKSSTYEVSNITNTPVILIINCKGMATSIAATLKGFVEYKKNNNIKGVILNNITKTTFSAIKQLIEEEFEGNITVLGYIPKLSKDLIFGSRHLGLVTSEEIEDIKIKLNKLAEVVEDTIDIDNLIKLASYAKENVFKSPVIKKFNHSINIAVAKDKAFCFYYRDNLELLQEMGANLLYFSPLNDVELPKNIDGLYIGGGYPELYVKELSQNLTMLKSIRDALSDNIPCIAECGGFMYLANSIDTYKMVSYLEGQSENTGKLMRFGYVTLTANKNNMLCKKGEKIKAHEFHYYDLTECGDSFTAKKTNKKTWKCVVSNDFLYAGYPHLNFYSNLHFAENFYKKCLGENYV
ncbi:cobyrinate a,c-diamide synthase [Sedimentibacter sp. zth1]|uniref:cobyrinate a,c-diamide synthase n=1 Tax=Sedimentibacter sp. zth1 TaxID=2816908 RepID=UPI001A918681|nr:cobyrinate a,c-diamide synthase [Sedimentibacter sp. zth1]QSX05349.1 cobyrinate a,c-diamide synthase [Sedimentibacter sp. zth1]